MNYQSDPFILKYTLKLSIGVDSDEKILKQIFYGHIQLRILGPVG
jgi:hypothetical protein